MAPHRYWRVLFLAGNSTQWLDIAELQFREVAGVPQSPTGGTASASSVNSTAVASRAFDNNVTTAWTAASNQVANSWLMYDYGAGNAKDIVELAVIAGTSSGSTPKDFNLEYSDDGATWKVATMIDNQIGWTSNQTRVYAVIAPMSRPERVTHLPVLLIDCGNSPVRVNEFPFFIIATETTDIPQRVNQLPVYVAYDVPPIPAPFPLIPDTPVNEVWEWLTVVTTAENSNEQRSALRATPRYSQNFDFVLLGDTDRYDFTKFLHKYLGTEFTYPQYHYSTNLTRPALANDTRLYFAPSRTDIRAGEKLAIVNPNTLQTEYATIAALHADGATLAAPLGRELTLSEMVCPAIPYRFPDALGLAMQSVAGRGAYTMESTQARAFVRPGAAVALTTFDGLPILDRPVLDSADENLTRRTTWFDNETAPPRPLSYWRAAMVSGERTYVADRAVDMDFWRAFADYAKGRHKPFFVPSNFNDLPLAVAPALGATQIVTTNLDYSEMWPSPAYRYIKIQSRNGVKYRRVLEPIINYTATGKPKDITLRLSSSIGNVNGDNDITRVSLLYKCRMDTDTIKLRHTQLDTEIDISIRTVNQ